MYENSWLFFFFFCYIQSVNIQNSLCGSRERHDVEKEKRKRKKVSDPVDESLRLAGRRKQNKTKKISTNEFNKIIITESQEEPSCLKLIKHKKKINFCVIFFFTFLNVYVTSTSIHHIISLYPSHDISFKMLHYSYYIKCRTTILSAKHISQRVHLHISVEKKRRIEEHGKKHWLCSPSLSGGGDVWIEIFLGWFGYLQVNFIQKKEF